MDHQNIAKVLDAGTTPQGRPYFAMELIKGIPITKYCDQEHLTPRERLELFIPVCQAVQHAHQKGVIHRDLKPSNVLIALYDGKPVPKVIDFGVAKATSQKLTERTLYTEVGQIVGTLEYMAPEQAELNNLDIDTRADIYSLGVILYELLAGSPPFTAKQLQGAGFNEMLRMIREVEPPRPSTRLSSSEALPSIAANRKLEPSRLTRVVHGDLNWIVMKALDKDRSRRYETANGFAMDIQRYLADEPVTAGAPGALYRMRKFARKHRAGLIATAAFAVLLVVGSVVSTWEAVRAVAAEARARTGEQQAQRAEAEAKAVLAFVKDRVLAAARPKGHEEGLGRDATIRQAVDAAEPQIAKSFEDKPAVEASIRSALGMTYVYLGQLDAAIRQLNRAVKLRASELGPDHPDTLEARNQLGEAYFDAGRTDDEIVLLEPTLKIAEQKLGSADPITIASRNDLAMAYSSNGRNAEAIALHEANLKETEAKFGPDNPQTLTSRNNLALAYWNANRIPDASALDEVTLKKRERLLGPDHPLTLTSRNNLALECNAVGRKDEAITMLETNLKYREAKLGVTHPDTLASRNSLAAVYWIAGRVDEARTMLESALAKLDSTLGPDHPTTLVTKSLLAEAYEASGLPAKVEPLLRDLLGRSKQQFGTDDPRTAPALAQLGGWLVNHDKPSEAEPMLRQCLAIREKIEPDNWTTFNTRSQLGGTLLGQGKYAEAQPLILAGYEGFKSREATILPQGKRRVPEAAERVVKLYQAWGKPEKAAEWREKVKAQAAAVPKPR
jgi:tetratricopeptide (TPR) repeat protein